MLTRTGRTLVAGGAAMALYGALFGNMPLIAAGAVPLFLAAAATSLPRAPEVRRGVSAARIERGGHVDVAVEAALPRGVGIVEIHQALPEEFELLEGNNLQVHTLRLLRPQRVQHRFRVRIPKRGEYELPPVTVRVVHPVMLSHVEPTPVGAPVTVEALPRPLPARIPRDLRARAKSPYPEGDLAQLGTPTNDFKEIRQYVPGDPVRRINWKATARTLTGGDEALPLVNETEREGKKKLWIIVDGHARLDAGTNLEDAREHAADAALSLAEAYLRRNFAVGLSLARSGPVPAELPGNGEGQVRRLRRALARLRADDSPTLMSVIERDAAHFHRNRPLVVLVTRLAGRDDDLERAIRRIGTMTQGRGLVPGLLVDVHVPPAQDPEGKDVGADAARVVLERQQLALHNMARAAGLRVVTWRPQREPLVAALVRGRVAG